MPRDQSDLGHAFAPPLGGHCIEAVVRDAIVISAQTQMKCYMRMSVIVHVVIYYGAAPVFAIMHVVIYYSGDLHRRPPECGAVLICVMN